MNTEVATRPKSFAPTTLPKRWSSPSSSPAAPSSRRSTAVSPGDILVCPQMGAELGLSPLSALQSISVINGKPSVSSDGAIALVQASGLLEEPRGRRRRRRARAVAATDRMIRRGRAHACISRSSRSPMRSGRGSAGRNVWKSYPDVMLVARARSACMRARVTSPGRARRRDTREEAVDYPPGVTSSCKDPKPHARLLPCGRAGERPGRAGRPRDRRDVL